MHSHLQLFNSRSKRPGLLSFSIHFMKLLVGRIFSPDRFLQTRSLLFFLTTWFVFTFLCWKVFDLFLETTLQSWLETFIGIFLIVDFRTYGETIESRLQAMGIKARLMFPPGDISIMSIIDRLARGGCLYAVVISNQNEFHRSCTLNILHGAPQGKSEFSWEASFILPAWLQGVFSALFVLYYCPHWHHVSVDISSSCSANLVKMIFVKEHGLKKTWTHILWLSASALLLMLGRQWKQNPSSKNNNPQK